MKSALALEKDLGYAVKVQSITVNKTFEEARKANNRLIFWTAVHLGAMVNGSYWKIMTSAISLYFIYEVIMKGKAVSRETKRFNELADRKTLISSLINEVFEKCGNRK